MDENDKFNLTAVLNERNDVLLDFKSSLNLEEGILAVSQKIESCIKYIPTFHISEINEEIFMWVLPLMKKSLIKAFNDNIDLSDTSDDEFVVVILKQHLIAAVKMMHIIDVFLDCISEQKDISISYIICFPSDTIEIIVRSFEHCKNSSGSYKSTFNTELLDLFKMTQKVHIKYLKVMGSNVTAGNGKNENTIIIQVLEMVFRLNNILFEVNLKSYSDNWKGYVNILTKHYLYINEIVDMRTAIESLTLKIEEILQSVIEMDSSDQDQVCRSLKLVGFLSKVVLKIGEIFWSHMENIAEALFIFCAAVYSFPQDYFTSLELSDVATQIDTNVFSILPLFLQKLADDQNFITVLTSCKAPHITHPSGLLYFIDSLLKIVCETEIRTVFSLEQIISIVFDSLKLSYAECYWGSIAESIFDKLVLHLSGVILIHPQFFPNIEFILLQNILGDDIWPALLALDVWTLLLSLAPVHLCLNTLLDLIKLEDKLNFGVNTYRPEQIHLRCLIKRNYNLLPNSTKSEVIKACPLQSIYSVSKLIGFENINERDIPIIYETAVGNMLKLGSNEFKVNDLKLLGETFELLSTLNFSAMNMDVNALLDVVTTTWDMNYVFLNNNVFCFFIKKLCKLSQALIKEFNSNQLLAIINQLKLISTNNHFKLATCDMVESLSRRNFDEFGQNGYQIFQLTSIVMSSLMDTTINVIKQCVLELIENLIDNEREMFVRGVVRTVPNLQCYIVEYLNKKETRILFDKDYYLALKNNNFKHHCVKCSNEIPNTTNKRLKLDENYSLAKSGQLKAEKLKFAPQITTKYKLSQSENSFQSNEDTVGEVIATLKGDVKCLMKTLQSDRLSAKNVSDLKIITNQLLSLM